MNWYLKEVKEIFKILNSGEHGLSTQEARRRLNEYGLNQLPQGKIDSIGIIFLRQFSSPLIYILIIAALIVFLMGDSVDGLIIFAVLLFNAIVGTIQEGKAQNTLLALKKFVETQATVFRDGKEIVISDNLVVPGDIIILNEGEKIPADARLIAANNLKVDEAFLTGESGPVHKIAESITKPNLPIAEQKNMVFKGTNILSGTGKAIVVATGVKTIIGKISKEIAAIDSEIPLKVEIRRFSQFIIFVVTCICLVLFFLGLISGKSLKEMFATVVSLSVSIIPEGLPIVMTLVLAMGVWRMSKNNALIKKLQAVEALGQASVIAVDKTGTITKNELVVSEVYVDGKFFQIDGTGYEPKGEVRLNGNVIDVVNHPELLLTGKIAAFCSNGQAMFLEKENVWRIIGDPTEVALTVFAQKLGFHKDDLQKEAPLIDEIPFDYKLKYHATLHNIAGKYHLSIIGAPEIIIGLSKKIWKNGKALILSDDKKNKLESVFYSLTQKGMRVIALAQSDYQSKILKSEKIKDLTFIGFFAMKDSLKPGVVRSIQKVINAGIKVVMITGDHKLTSLAIAKEAGIYNSEKFNTDDIVLTGKEIDQLSNNELIKKLSKVLIFARVTPEHKLKIIQAFKSRGDIIAMTGDGVNDAPSLVAADLGIAMGKIGTEVAKEASDIVLVDDNFQSIVSAIEEGRNIYKTIKKVILYLFAGSAGQVLIIVSSILLEFPLPLLPVQIIWLNFVTDGFLDVSLAMEPKEDGLLNKNFKRSKNFIDKVMIQRIVLMSITMMLGGISIFSFYINENLAKARTMLLTTLAMFHWFNAWNCRHDSKSIFKMNIFSNKFLLISTVIIVFLQLIAIYNPIMQKFLRTTPLTFSDWLIIIPTAFSIIIIEELRKFLVRKN
jgi:Ca2+-transporting ATPase